MKATYEDIAAKWGALAEATYVQATSLEGDEEKVRNVYQRFKEAEEGLFQKEGWTYEEFRQETLSRTAKGSSTDDSVQQ